jgi:hypothetical protein
MLALGKLGTETHLVRVSGGNPMSKVLLNGVAIASLALLACCVDAGDLPNIGGSPVLQRGIDQDITATHSASGPQIRNESTSAPTNWRRLDQ